MKASLLLVVCRWPSAFCPFRECFSYRDLPHSKVTLLSRSSSHPMTFRNHKGLAVLAHLKDNRVLALEFPVRFCGVLWEPLLPLHSLPHPVPDPLIPFLRYWHPVLSQVNIQTGTPTYNNWYKTGALGAGPMYSSKRNEGWMIKELKWGIPRWLSGKESTCQCRRHRLDPSLGRLHMPWRNCACAPQLLNPHSRAQQAQLLKPACPRAHAPQRESSPLLVTKWEKACIATEIQYNQKEFFLKKEVDENHSNEEPWSTVWSKNLSILSH